MSRPYGPWHQRLALWIFYNSPEGSLRERIADDFMFRWDKRERNSASGSQE